ncbi:putative casein kinase II subunit alpha [Atractiella rhizophila]|nr:putative casein kinase II subunit alpha [Atractiella rhizophila]
MIRPPPFPRVSQQADLWSAYELYRPNWGETEQYVVIRKVGKGKYGDVFEGRRGEDGERVAIKVLKPVKKDKILREIKILQNLYGGPNIIKMQDMVMDWYTKTPSLIFPFVETSNFKTLNLSLNLKDIKYYIFLLLTTLDWVHSKGIMHRDVKPTNVLINHKQHSLRLVDWGLAEFYIPGKRYETRVASRYFKAPELLVGYEYYSYSLDIWSVGCILASMIFKVDPFFYSKGAMDEQLYPIGRVLGSVQLVDWMDKYSIPLHPGYQGIVTKNRWKGKAWKKFIDGHNKPFVDEAALRFLEETLKYDHQTRLSARELMQWEWFGDVREEAQKSIQLQKGP